MAKVIISLCAVILSCILLVHAEPPVSSYSISGDNNGYEYNNNIMNGAFTASKDGHRENADYYTGGNSGHSLTNGRSQGNLEESLRSSSFNGFSPSSHNSAFQGYSGTARESLGTSSYFLSEPTQSSFEGFANSNTNGDSPLEAYTSGTDQSTFSQYSSNKNKNSAYMGFADTITGASNTGSYSEIATEGSPLREYSGDAFRGHVAGGYMDGDQVFNKESLNLFNGPSSDYSFGKPKDAMFAIGNSNKYVNDVYSAHPDMRYVRGNHGNMGREYGSPMYATNSGSSSPYSSTRGNTGLYSSGKFSKYNKYSGDYAPNGGVNYVPKDQEADYLVGNYGKGSGKVVSFKDSRPSSYSNQAYVNSPSYLSKLVGSYKSKPSYMSYPSGSHIGYSSMSNLHSNYGDSPAHRRYRSSSGYVPGHGSTYSGYY